MTFTKLMATAALTLGLATGAFAQDKTKVGFVFVGPVGDGGWTYEHNQGRLALPPATSALTTFRPIRPASMKAAPFRGISPVR